MWSNKEYKERLLKKFNTPEAIEKNRQRGIELMKNPEHADKILKSSFRYKDHVLPSGKIVKLQGYEHIFLDEYFKQNGSEDDIFIGVKEIHQEIGHISYTYENTQHTYYPDFYIKSTNTIIEVKSNWTFRKHKEKNIAKEHACLKQGFKFEFKIY